ncbi:MAG: hypothetical protein ABI890_04980 [Lapillicoccus sp.]
MNDPEADPDTQVALEASLGTDRERLQDARRVITGEDTQREGNALYVTYVAVIAAGAYGVPASQQFFRFLDPAWMAQHLTGVRGLAAGVVLAAALLLLAFRAGGIHGPVVPDLPYLDHVASSPLDRTVVLRRWWRLGLLGCVVGGTLIGLVTGAGLAIAAVSSPVVLVPAVVLGAVVGLLVAGAWLQGQVRTWPRGDRGLGTFLRQGRSLRALHLTALRTQSARSVTIGGAVLAGDLRAARLDVAAPTTRGRGLRLRARGPVGTLVSRDVLGLRRSPGALVTGLALVAVAASGLEHSATPGTPSVIALGALFVGYFGIGAWSEGLRLQGDNAGTPPLIGVPARTEALAHLITPGLLYVGVCLVVGAATAATGGGSGFGIGWAAIMVAVLLAGQLMAAFRGLPPISLFAPGRGIGTTLLWYSVPMFVPAVVGTASTALLTSSLSSNAPLVVALGSYAAFLFGLRRVRLLTDAHRE